MGLLSFLTKAVSKDAASVSAKTGLEDAVKAGISGAIKSDAKKAAEDVAAAAIKSDAKKAAEDVAAAAAKKAGTSLTKKITLAAAGAAVTIGVTELGAKGESAADLKNSTPLTITAISEATDTTGTLITFANPKNIILYTDDDISITASDSTPSIDGKYSNLIIVSSTQIELPAIPAIATNGTTGTITISTNAAKEAANIAENIPKDLDTDLTAASAKLKKTLEIVGILAAVIAVLVFIGYILKIKGILFPSKAVPMYNTLPEQFDPMQLVSTYEEGQPLYDPMITNYVEGEMPIYSDEQQAPYHEQPLSYEEPHSYHEQPLSYEEPHSYHEQPRSYEQPQYHEQPRSYEEREYAPAHRSIPIETNGMDTDFWRRKWA